MIQVPLCPATDVYIADNSGELVLLDLRKNEYLCASPTLSEVIRWAFTPDKSPLPANAHELIGPLVQRGLLVENKLEAFVVSKENATSQGLSLVQWRPLGGRVIEDPHPTNLRTTLTALRFLRHTNKTLLYRDAHGLVNELRQRKIKPRRKHKIHINSLVESHIRARMLYPRTTLCFDGAAALALHAWALNIAAEFVIGVQNRPFMAHAWVEVDGHIVSDLPYFQEALVPILRIP